MGVGPVGHPEGSGHRQPRQQTFQIGRFFRMRASLSGTDAHTDAYTLARTNTRTHTRVGAWHALPFDAAAGLCAWVCACACACVCAYLRACGCGCIWLCVFMCLLRVCVRVCWCVCEFVGLCGCMRALDAGAGVCGLRALLSETSRVQVNVDETPQRGEVIPYRVQGRGYPGRT